MADTLVTADEVREQFSVAPEITGLASCVASASRQLRGWVGKTVYDDALEGDNATDKERAASLKAAEAYLAVYHALLTAGLRVRPSGVVRQEQDAAGPMGGTVINQYLTPRELGELRKQYLAQAEEITARYRLQTSGRRVGTMTLGGGWRGGK